MSEEPVAWRVVLHEQTVSDPAAFQAVVEQGLYEMRELARRPLRGYDLFIDREGMHEERVPQRWWERLLRRPVRYEMVMGPGSRRMLVITERPEGASDSGPNLSLR